MFRLFRNYEFFPRFAWRDFLVLFGGITVFVAIAASTVDKFSIWFDEAFGSYLVRFDFLQIANYTAHDVHPPLYYWLLKIWTTFFGNTELGIRSMSIFFGAVTIIFTFLVVLRLFGRRAAQVSVLFLILTPLFVRYSQEGRMYTVLTAIVMAATYMLIYALHNKKRWPWIVYGVLIAAGMLTQYFTALIWIAHWVWRYSTVRVKGESFQATVRRMLTKEWWLAYGVAVLLFLPWLPFLAIQFLIIQGNGFWIPPVTSATLPDFLTDVLLFSDFTGVQSWLAAGFYLVVGVMAYTTYRLLRQFKDDDRKNYLFILCMVAVPVVVLFTISMPPLRSAFVDRYLLAVAVFMSVLFAINMTRSHTFLGKKFRIFVSLVTITLMVVGLFNQSVIGNYNRSSGQSNNTRQLLEKIQEQSAPGTPILSKTPWIFYEAVVYDRPTLPVFFIDETTEYKYGSLTMLAENDQHKIKDLNAFTRDHRVFWMISNLRDSKPEALRDNWHVAQTITINDDLSKQPLFQAVRFTVE